MQIRRQVCHDGMYINLSDVVSIFTKLIEEIDAKAPKTKEEKVADAALKSSMTYFREIFIGFFS